MRSRFSRRWIDQSIWRCAASLGILPQAPRVASLKLNTRCWRCFSLCCVSCPSDATVQFHSPPSGHEQRFSLEAFEFIAENLFVFIHCDVKVCNATDPNSACTRACPARKRRHIGHGPSDVTDVYSLAQGPLVMEKGPESDEPAGDVPSSGEPI